jgi:hypothetical protein
MKVGDLVRFKEEHPYKKVGIIVDTGFDVLGPEVVKVVWSNDYGTFWDKTKRLEVLSESR